MENDEKEKNRKKNLGCHTGGGSGSGGLPVLSSEIGGQNGYVGEEFKELLSTYSIGGAVPLYKEYAAGKGDNRPGGVIEVDAGSYSRYEENGIGMTPTAYENYEGMAGTSIVTAENAIVEYDVTVPESGWYDLSMVYYPIEGKSSEIQRGFFVDGALPYRELADVEFSRIWKVSVEGSVTDAKGIAVKAWEKDNQGNDMKPSMVEVPEWVTTPLYDSDGYVLENLALYLEQGEHTISIVSRKEPMLLRKLVLGNIQQVVPYQEVKAAWDAQGAQDTSGHMIRVEAENAVKTSSQMLYPQQDQSSPAVYPSSTKELLNNSIGGNSWKLSGQWMEWALTYRRAATITFLYMQSRISQEVFTFPERFSLTGQCPLRSLTITDLHTSRAGGRMSFRTRQVTPTGFIWSRAAIRCGCRWCSESFPRLSARCRAASRS